MKLNKFLTAVVIFGLVVAVFVISKINREKMFLKTSDGIKIAYDWYSSVDSREVHGYVILIHMMPAVKESWENLAKRLQKEGYASIAIDLRGHGQSDGGPKGYQKFSDQDHQKSILDLESAVEFLKSKGATPDNIYLIGASIGANLSLQYLAEHPVFKKAVLLSVGLDYRGIKTKPLYRNLKSDQKVLAVSSRDDGSNAKENEELFGKNAENLIIYNQGGHGTNILNEQPELTEKIILWLQEKTI